MKKIYKYFKLAGSILSATMLIGASIDYYMNNKQPDNFTLLVFISCAFLTYSNWDE